MPGGQGRESLNRKERERRAAKKLFRPKGRFPRILKYKVVAACLESGYWPGSTNNLYIASFDFASGISPLSVEFHWLDPEAFGHFARAWSYEWRTSTDFREKVFSFAVRNSKTGGRLKDQLSPNDDTTGSQTGNRY